MQANRLESFAGSCARLALFSALLLNLAVLSQAQTTPPPPPHSAVAASTKPAAQPSGNHEGIKIHGHWIIEVKNPDGKVVTHREFENSLAPSGTGASLLAAYLGAVVTPGSWMVQIRDLATDTTTPGNYIWMAEAVPPNSSPATLLCVFAALAGGTCSPAPLSVTGPTVNAATGSTPVSFTGTTLTLTGSATVPPSFTAASIGYVETDNIPCPASVSIQTCTVVLPAAGVASNTLLGSFAFTERNLDGLNGDPAPVSVSVGQTVSVKVQLSFQ